MKLGEVGLLTDDVIGLAVFYKSILRIDNYSNDNVHQTLIAEETMLTISTNNTKKNNLNQNICIVFTVDNVDKEHKRLLDLGVKIIEEPVTRPWGARNMSFYDPDNNVIYFRSFIDKKIL